MERLQDYAMPVGRVLMAFIFVLSGLMKLGDVPANMAYIESGGLPGILIWPTILVEVAGGLAVALGWQTRAAALFLAGFTLLAGLLYHLIPAGSAEGAMAQMQVIMFLKNLSITGGLLILFAIGGGAYSLDARHGQAARG